MTNIYLEKEPLKVRRTAIKKQVLPPLDRSLLLLTSILIVLGLVFTYSSSAFDTVNFFKRQIIFDVLGLIVMFFLARYYMRLQELIKPNILLYITWGLLIWALFTAEAANVHRWIRLGPINIQPSEFAKLVLIIFLSKILFSFHYKISFLFTFFFFLFPSFSLISIMFILYFII